MGILGKIAPLRGTGARRLDEDVALLRKSPLLDPVWYRKTYADLRDTPIDVARHYLEYGAREGRNPGPLFDTKLYLAENPDVAKSEINPLVHYLVIGSKRGAALNHVGAPLSPGIQPTQAVKYALPEAAEPEAEADGSGQDVTAELWTQIDIAARKADGFDNQGQVYDFLLQHQVEANGLPFGYRSTGSDPHSWFVSTCRLVSFESRLAFIILT